MGVGIRSRRQRNCIPSGDFVSAHIVFFKGYSGGTVGVRYFMKGFLILGILLGANNTTSGGVASTIRYINDISSSPVVVGYK